MHEIRHSVRAGDGHHVEFYNPADLAFDSVGQLLVCDEGYNRIHVLTSAGQFVTQIDTLPHPLLLRRPCSLHIAGDGRIFVGGRAPSVHVLAFPV